MNYTNNNLLVINVKTQITAQNMSLWRSHLQRATYFYIWLFLHIYKYGYGAKIMFYE